MFSSMILISRYQNNIISNFFSQHDQHLRTAFSMYWIMDEKMSQNYICVMSFFKGIVNQFWIYNTFSVTQQKKHIIKKVHLDETTLTRNSWEKWCSKSARVIYRYILYNCGPVGLTFVKTQKNVINSILIGEQSL